MQVAGHSATAMTRQSGTSEVSVKIETKIVKNKKNEVIGVIFLQSCKIKMCLSYRKNLKRSQCVCVCSWREACKRFLEAVAIKCLAVRLKTVFSFTLKPQINNDLLYSLRIVTKCDYSTGVFFLSLFIFFLLSFLVSFYHFYLCVVFLFSLISFSKWNHLHTKIRLYFILLLCQFFSL